MVLDSITGIRRFGHSLCERSISLSSLTSLTVFEYSVSVTLLTLMYFSVTWRLQGPFGFTIGACCEHSLANFKSSFALSNSSISYWSLRAVRITKLDTPPRYMRAESGSRTFSRCRFSQSTCFLKLGSRSSPRTKFMCSLTMISSSVWLS